MADSPYDEPGNQATSSSTGGSRLRTPSGNSTSGGGASFSRGDSLDPVRKAEGGGLWKPHGDTAGSSGSDAARSPTSGPGSDRSSGGYDPTPRNLKGSEESPEANGNSEASGFARGFPSNNNSTKKGRIQLSRRGKAIIAVGTSTIVAGSIGFFSISSGPFEFIHLAQLLERFHFSAQEDAQNSRLVQLARYIHDPTKPQNTRLGFVGNAVADHLEKKIRDSTGFGPAEFDSLGNFRGYPIDKNHPDFKDIKDDNRKVIQKIVDTYPGITESNITVDPSTGDLLVNPGNNGSSSKNPITSAKDYLAKTSFARAQLGRAGYNKLASWTGSRVLRTRAGWTFHTIQKIDKTIWDTAVKGGKKAIDKLKNQELQKEAQVEDGTTVTTTPEERSKTKEKLKTGAKTAAGLAAFGCVGLGAQQQMQQDKYDKAILPMARKAGQFVSLGSQVQKGGDLTAEQIGFYKDFLDEKDSSGKVVSTWNQATSIQAELGQPQTGKDIPPAGQVFSGTPLDFLNGIPLLPQFCSATGGIIGTILGGIQGLLLSPVVDAGTSAFADWQTGTPVDPFASGADFGNYVNYGARISANDQYASAGGVQLSSSEEITLKDTSNSLDNNDFQKKSLAYRLFNPYDSQTLLSNVMDSQTPNATQNIARLTKSFGSIFSSLFKLPGMLFSSIVHATPPSYDYHGLKAAGFTAQELTDPLFNNPFDNACWVVGNCTLKDKTPISYSQSVLGDPTHPSVDMADLLDRITTCFGDKVTPDSSGNWDINFNTSLVNMYDDAYSSANCKEDSTPWKRIRFWLIDTATIEGYDCGTSTSDTADQSCKDMGFNSSASNSSSSSSQTTAGTLPTGSAQDLAKQLVPFVNSGKVKCQTSGCPDIVNTANGVSIRGGQGCQVDALDHNLVGMLLELVQMGHNFLLSALCSDHPGDGINEHSGGHAADFNYIDGVFMGPADAPWDSTKDAAAKKLDQDVASFMPKSTEFGQVGAGNGHPQCHPGAAAYDFQAGFKVYPDFCHHQHIRAGD